MTRCRFDHLSSPVWVRRPTAAAAALIASAFPQRIRPMHSSRAIDAS